MTAFVRSLGIQTNGAHLRAFKDQLARLAAATVRFAVGEEGQGVQINTQIVGAFDLWFPKDERQRVLWPTVIRLSDDYFQSLSRHAVPLDQRAVAELKGSALCLDIYGWLAQRLHRIEPGQPQTVTWQRLKEQFGADYARVVDFRARFIPALRMVRTGYPSARVEVTREGLILSHSEPPVSRRLIRSCWFVPVTGGLDG